MTFGLHIADFLKFCHIFDLSMRLRVVEDHLRTATLRSTTREIQDTTTLSMDSGPERWLWIVAR